MRLGLRRHGLFPDLDFLLARIRSLPNDADDEVLCRNLGRERERDANTAGLGDVEVAEVRHASGLRRAGERCTTSGTGDDDVDLPGAGWQARKIQRGAVGLNRSRGEETRL